MKHDIFFNTKDLLIEWLDENFPETTLTHIFSNGAKYSASGCTIEVNGLHLIIDLDNIDEA